MLRQTVVDFVCGAGMTIAVVTLLGLALSLSLRQMWGSASVGPLFAIAGGMVGIFLNASHFLT